MVVLERKSISADIGSKIHSLNQNNITLRCRATGIPKPDITWTKNGITLQNKEEVLRIFSAKMSDGGVYQCRAEKLGLFDEKTSDIQISG